MENHKKQNRDPSNKFNKYKIKHQLLLITELIKLWSHKKNNFHSMNKWLYKFHKIFKTVFFKNLRILLIQICRESKTHKKVVSIFVVKIL